MEFIDKKKIWTYLELIPRGCVVTYRQFAEMTGYSDHQIRAIGTVVSQLPIQDTTLPWHRIVYANGSLVTSKKRRAVQKKRLQQEGITISLNNKVSFQTYLWTGKLA